MARLEEYHNTGLSLTHSIDEDPKDKQFPMHVHDNYEIYCFVSGKASYMVEGHIYDLRPGSLMLMRSAETHKLIVNGSGRYERYTLNFRPELLTDNGFPEEALTVFTERELGKRNLYLPGEFEEIKPVEFFAKCFRELEYLPKREVLLANIAAFLCAIFTAYMRMPEPPYREDRDLGREVIDFVNANLFEELSLEMISKEVHMSPSQIGRSFRKLTGTSVYDYILSKRLIVAQEMIAKGVSATEACQECGFRDYSAFYRLCKKRLGAAPTQTKRSIEKV